MASKYIVMLEKQQCTRRFLLKLNSLCLVQSLNYDEREPRKIGTGRIETALCKPLKIYFYCHYLKGLATDISFLKRSSSSTKDGLFLLSS